MAVIGSVIKGLLGGYGDIPDQLTPKFKDMSLIQQETLAGNQQVLPGAQALASSVNRFQLDERLAAFDKIIPGFSAKSAQYGKNIDAGLKGELAPGTVDWLRRITAEGAYAGGSQGSQAANFALAQNIGTTAEKLQQDAATSFERWTANSSANINPSQYDFTSLFFSPQQRAGVEDQRSQMNFMAETRNASLRAAPDPFMQALGDAFIQDEQQIMQLVGSAAGGAAGGGL